MSELDTIYLIAASQAVAMFAITAVYYALRLKIERAKEQSARASFEAMVTYHSRRLDIEEEKLELARKNGNGKKDVDLFEVAREIEKKFPKLKNADTSVEPTATMGTGVPAELTDEEIAEFANPSEVRLALDAKGDAEFYEQIARVRRVRRGSK